MSRSILPTATVLLIATALVTAAQADTIYVCWDGSGDYLTIQEGIDAASDDDEVVVCDGTYAGPGNRDLLVSTGITIRSENGPDTCIIDCQDSGCGFWLEFSFDRTIVVDGFTITNGIADFGGGIFCMDSTVTIADCKIIGNAAGALGGGVCFFGAVDATMVNCTIAENTTGGVYAFNNTVTLTNCAVTGNSGDGVHYYDAHLAITNCTISANSWAGIFGYVEVSEWGSLAVLNSIVYPGGIVVEGVGMTSVTYSDIGGGWPGEGNIDADPLFATGPLGDYYLGQTAAGQDEDSPCVDAGSDTAESLGLDTRTTRTDQVTDGDTVDMGYHYPTVCFADLDRDWDIDLADLATLLANYGTTSGMTYWDGDLEFDGDVDLADLLALLAVYGTTCE
jgi:hypothetical protein